MSTLSKSDGTELCEGDIVEVPDGIARFLHYDGDIAVVERDFRYMVRIPRAKVKKWKGNK